MTRKRLGLWLHKPIRIRNAIHPNTKTRIGTPLKDNTPKRTRILYTCTCIPCSPFSLSKRRSNTSKESTQKRRKLLSPCHSFQSPIFNSSCSRRKCPDLHLLIETTVTKLEASGKAKDFVNFLSLVKEDKFPLDNISFLLFLETTRFYSQKHTSEMWYYTETKRFWKTGYRPFHGKFLYYMDGPRNVDQVTESYR